jgi:hypothetical protein
VKEYDALGNLLSTYEYDASGNLVSQSDPTGTSYTHYPVSGRMHIKTFPSGIIYEYSDDAVHEVGQENEYGYLLKETQADGSYKTFSDYFSSDISKYAKEYDKDSNLLITYEYNAAGGLIKKTEADGTVYTFYAVSHNVESALYPSVDGADNIYYHFLDENFFGGADPRGRTNVAVRSVKDTDGAIGYIFQYYANSAIAQFKRCYVNADYSDVANPSLANLVVTYEYDELGNMINKDVGGEDIFVYYPGSGRLYKQTTSAGVIYEFSDEAVHNVGQANEYGYLVKETQANGSYKTFSDYYSADQERYTREYDKDGNLLITYEYDASGNLINVTGADAAYTYYQPSGNMHTKRLLVADDRGTPDLSDDIPAGTIFEYDDTDVFDNGTPSDPSDDFGHLIKQTNPNNSYKTFSDYYSALIAKYVKE